MSRREIGWGGYFWEVCRGVGKYSLCFRVLGWVFEEGVWEVMFNVGRNGKWDLRF